MGESPEKSGRVPLAVLQKQKFVDAARKLGGGVTESKFDETLKRVGKAKLTHPPRKKPAPDVGHGD